MTVFCRAIRVPQGVALRNTMKNMDLGVHMQGRGRRGHGDLTQTGPGAREGVGGFPHRRHHADGDDAVTTLCALSSPRSWSPPGISVASAVVEAKPQEFVPRWLKISSRV